ncbi:MAG: hypothetical protein WB439_14920 [Acidobacteriaceae bacterium]
MKIASIAASCLLIALPATCLAHGTSSIRGGGVEVSFDRSGVYTVGDAHMNLTLTGKLPGAAETVRSTSGRDAMGTYRQLEASYEQGERVAAIRLYSNRGAVLFLDIHKESGANADSFPSFQSVPQSLMRFSYRVVNFSPIDFGKLDSQGPWVFFDHDRNTMVLSPADNFLVSEMDTSSDGAMRSGISPAITSLPSGFTHRTLLVFGSGVTKTLDRWGSALQSMNRKPPVANDADVVLNRFGYWTDNGAKYYYKFDPALGYEGTLLAIRDQFKQLGVPLGYLQLDSWWYPKQKGNNAGDDNGALEYRADPTIFPDGLAGFDQRLKLPLVTHARWISQSSPYRKEYKMSDNVIIDPRYWNATAKYLHDGGVVVYEQDWLNRNARPAINIDQAHAYLDDMADSMAKQDIGIQYCMALPGYFMASTRFGDLRTIRTSDDHFMPARYDTFLYTSELAHAVGLWPWADVFMSSELSNLVVATLSAGPVGTGDSLGTIDADNLKRAVRADSVILKPDTPLTPIDAMYLADASGDSGAKGPMIAITQSNFGSVAETYVFSYPRVGNGATDNHTSQVPLSELGISKSVYVWNWKLQKGSVIPAGGSLGLQYSDGWGYEVLAPISEGGIALLGDVSKIVPLARKRFPSVSSTGALEATVSFATGESSITLTGYATHRPRIAATEGKVGGQRYDDATHLFSFEVSPGTEQMAKVSLR